MERQGEVPHVGFGRSVGGEARERNERGERRHIQNPATLSGRHRNKCRARKERQRGDIDSDLIRFTRCIKLGNLAESSVASIIDKDLNRSSAIQDASFYLRHIGTLRKVGDDRLARRANCGGEPSDTR